MAATMKDIAKRTGLGLATISSYFNGGNVREKNRIKIEEAIGELHYEVNEVARGLKLNATKTVGVVIPELNNVFCAEVITGMEDILRSHGYAAIVCDCRTDQTLEKEAVDFLMRKRVDGIINMPVDSKGEHLKAFQKTGKPIVLIDRSIQGLSCDCVLVDNQRAAFDAVELLIKNGHRNIGILGGPRDVYTARERLDGYWAAHKTYGIPVQEALIYHGDYTIQGGVKGLTELYRRNPHMTAVFVTNYEMTMGAVIGINELGISIPVDLSVIGFDNLQFARACSPKLTIVSQPTESIAREVARIILKRLENPHREQPESGPGQEEALSESHREHLESGPGREEALSESHREQPENSTDRRIAVPTDSGEADGKASANTAGIVEKLRTEILPGKSIRTLFPPEQGGEDYEQTIFVRN